MARYAWQITEDAQYGPNGAMSKLYGYDREFDEGGVVGPSDITDLDQKALPKGRAFRMYDDDGELVYRGRYVGPDNELMFRPLDDFGAPNYGCTEIRYRNPETGCWEAL